MRIIDLLNTPLNELPQKIKVEDKTYTLFIDEDTGYHYYQDDKCKYFMFSISCFEELNEEVEIIEENKKIEKVSTYVICDYDFKNKDEDNNLIATNIIDKAFEEYSQKINEIIDKINEDR